MTEAHRTIDQQLLRAAKVLAVLALQSPRYSLDGEFQQAVDDVLHLELRAEIERLRAALERIANGAFTVKPGATFDDVQAIASEALQAAQPDEIGSAGTGGVTLAQMAENIKHGLDPYTGDVPQAAQPDEAQPDANRLRSLLRSCFLDEHHASKALYDEIRKVVNAHETTAEQR